MPDNLEQKIRAAWDRTDELFGTLEAEAIAAQPIAWRHPFIFYAGHLPAFASNQICRELLRQPSLQPQFDDLFSRGIDPDLDTGECQDHPDAPPEWPDLSEVFAYRDAVRDTVLEAIADVSQGGTNGPINAAGRIFRMVIEHELMHQETLLYMVQELPAELKRRPRELEYSFAPARERERVAIPEGRATLGAAPQEVAFGWDNEFPRKTVRVPGFLMDSTPVTNGEFLEFVESGGYGAPQCWTREDWAWREKRAVGHPNFWQRDHGGWFYRTVFDVLPLECVGSWPVYVTLAEARAYACWRGKRLPTESEYHRAAFGTPGGEERLYPWGWDGPGPQHGNFDFQQWSPCPVGSCPGDGSAWGIHELVGNGWEWTETPFAPFPRFRPLETYPEYSTDFFDGKHFVLKGASWATALELLRPSFRNWFQARYPYVFAKFRCVSDL